MNSHGTILVVDDNQFNVDLLVQELEDVGYKTVTASDGEAALQTTCDCSPDLILLDIMMPGISGLEVCSRLKQNDATNNIPIIIVTAKDSSVDMVIGLDSGANDYVAKPFDMGELLARVRTQLKIKQCHDQLATLSITDPLTGIYNKRFLLGRLDEELSRAQRYQYPISCIMIDVDDFKKINDKRGHLDGDLILKEITSLILNNTRQSDIVARFGGEEFVLLLPHTDIWGTKSHADNMRHTIECHKFLAHSAPQSLTVSMGAASSRDCPPTAEELLREADKALYQAKREGKNRVVCYNEDVTALATSNV